MAWQNRVMPRFQKGFSGNPLGRPPGIANKKGFRRILTDLKDTPEKTVKFFLDLRDGKIDGATIADRRAAAEFIAKWQFGKPPEVIPEEDDLSETDEKIPEELAEILKFPNAEEDQ